MAISGGDGSIILTTKVDTSGINKGSVSIKTALQGVDATVKKVQNSFSDFSGKSVTLQKLNQAIKDQRFVLDSLNLEYAEYVANGKASSAEAQKLREKIDATTAEMREMEAAATTLGAKGKTALNGIGLSLKRLLSYFIGIQTIYKTINFAKEAKELYKVQMQNEVKLATVMRQRMNATDEQIKQVLELTATEQRRGIIGDEVQLAGLQQLSTFASQKEVIETLLPAMNNLIAQQYGYEASTESARNAANLMGKVLQGQTGALTRVGITFTESEKQMLETGNEMERASVLAQVITNNVGEMNKALAKTDIGRQKQLANTFGDIKEQFGAAVSQISIVFLPVLKEVANVLSKIALIARTSAQNIANAFGKSSDNANAQNNAIKDSVDNQNALTDAIKDTEKAQKKSLAGFDEIQTLTENTETSQSDISDELGDESIPSGGIFSGGIQSISGDIDAELATIMGYVGAALAAIGIILICFGHIGWGIGFIIAGASAFVVSQAALAEGEAAEKAKAIMNGIITGISLLMLVLGIIIVCTTKNPKALALGIGLIVSGAAGLASEIAINWNAIKEPITNFFTENAGIIMATSAALLVLGIILLFVPHAWGLGLGLITVGAVGLAAEATLNPEGFKDIIINFFNDNASIIKKTSLTLLVLGIILLFTPARGLGVGLIIVGAAGLASEIVLNPNEMTDTITNFFKDNAQMITEVSSWLLVLGIILLFVPHAWGLGLGLITVGAVGLAAEIKLNPEAMEDTVRTFLATLTLIISAFAIALGVIMLVGGHIGLGLGLLALGLGGVFFSESMRIDGSEVSSQIESELNEINDVATRGVNNINGTLSGINFSSGGVGVGYDYSTATAMVAAAPRLAKGTVIPPNREFLAVLGDQKRGVNIEAPLDTIKQAFRDELKNMSGTPNQAVNINFTGNLAQLARVLKPQIERESLREGTSMITGGAY